MHKLTAEEAREIAYKAKPRELTATELYLINILATAKIGRYELLSISAIPHDSSNELRAMGYDIHVDEDGIYHISWGGCVGTNTAHANSAAKMKYLVDSAVKDDYHSDFLSFMLSKIEYVAKAGYGNLIQTGALDHVDLSAEQIYPATKEGFANAVRALKELGYYVAIDNDGNFIISWEGKGKWFQ